MAWLNHGELTNQLPSYGMAEPWLTDYPIALTWHG